MILLFPMNLEPLLSSKDHKDKDILSIGKWIKARAYYLQAFVDSGDLICPGLSGHEKETMERYIQLLSPYVENSSVRDYNYKLTFIYQYPKSSCLKSLLRIGLKCSKPNIFAIKRSLL